MRACRPITVPLTQAQGLVLGGDVVAPLSLPVFDNSAMDGYAVRAEDTSGATPQNPVMLPVAEDIPAGRADMLTLQPVTAHRIMTGAPVPTGATAIVPVEATDGGVDSVAIRQQATPGKHIRRSGEDVAQFGAILDRYAVDADLIITSGGVSAGAYEVVKDAFGSADYRGGDHGVEFVKVAMQPGMPQGVGRVAGTPIVTLPGNPVSALVSFEVFIRPPLRMAMGLPDPYRPHRSAVLTASLTSPRGKRQFRRAILDHQAGTVISYGPPASHHLRWLASANGLLDIPEDVVEVAAGTQLQVWDLT